MPEQARGKYSGVIENEQVVRSQQLRKAAKLGVAMLSTRAVQMHHAGAGTVIGGMLGDQRGRQVKVEVGYEHRASL